MKRSNVGRFYAELVRFQLGRFEKIDVSFESAEIKLDGYVDAGYLISIFEKHAGIFRFMDTVDIEPNQWVIIECDMQDIQVLIFATSTYITETIVERMKRAVEFGRNQKGWNGRLFYTQCNDNINIEIK